MRAAPSCVATGCWGPGTSPIGGVVLCTRHAATIREVIAQEIAAKTEAEGLATLTPAFAGIVYYLTFDNGRTVKIGTSTRPALRFRALQSQATSDGLAGTLKLLACHPGHFKEERALHAKFEELRVHGEYFRAGARLRRHLAKVREDYPNWRELPAILDRRSEAA